jgi:hypothetical protein
LANITITRDTARAFIDFLAHAEPSFEDYLADFCIELLEKLYDIVIAGDDACSIITIEIIGNSMYSSTN